MWQMIATWSVIGYLIQERLRKVAEEQALMLAEESSKPIINIGAKCTSVGDVRCDIEPRCGAVYCDAENLSEYHDKQFSVALLSHVLEHLDNPDIALAEAQRIADNVITVTPSPLFLPQWFIPEHKWVYFNTFKVRIR